MKKEMTGWLDVRWDDTEIYPTKEEMDHGSYHTKFFDNLEPFHGKLVKITIEEIENKDT